MPKLKYLGDDIHAKWNAEKKILELYTGVVGDKNQSILFDYLALRNLESFLEEIEESEANNAQF